MPLKDRHALGPFTKHIENNGMTFGRALGDNPAVSRAATGPPERNAEWSGHKIVSIFRKIFDARPSCLCYTEGKISAARTAFPERAPKAGNPAPEQPA